jgi:hypothetical protein
MNKLLSSLLATVLGMAFALPLNAAPLSMPKPEQVQQSAVEQVKHRRHWRRNYGHWRGGRHWNRRHAWRDCRYDRCYPRRHYGRYYGRHYGYREYYPRHYRRRPSVSIYLHF